MPFSETEINSNFNKTILVVDDEDSILQVLKIGLRNHGYEVLTADTARRALDISGKRKFRFALLDIRLPDMNGIDLSWEMKKNDPGIITILMTGYPGIKSAVKALRHHAYDYLIKPFRVEQLLTVIEKALREIKLVGENNYSAEIIRSLKQENEQLKAMLKELMPDETRLRVQSFNKYRSIPSDKEDVLRLYSKQKGNSTSASNDKER